MLYAIIGAFITGVPLAILLVSQSYHQAALKQQILYYKNCEQQALYLYVWTLNKDIAAGKKITRADLEKKKVWVSESDHIDMSIDIQQITGNKAKTDLKQGTVVQSDLFYYKKKQKNAS